MASGLATATMLFGSVVRNAKRSVVTIPSEVLRTLVHCGAKMPATGPQVFRNTLGTEDDEDSHPDEHNGDVEPSLGFTENLDQAARLLVDPSSWPLDDGEEDIQDQPHDWDELEEGIGSLAIQLPDGTIVNDREGAGMSLDGITDDHGICDSDALADVSLSFRPLGRHGGRQIAEQLLADHGS
jgi:hypothetical protein